MSAANERNTAKVVPIDGARAQRDAAAPALDTAGAMLRAAREDAGYSLGEVSDEINVKVDRLAAIEANDLAALPSAPYALGFVRAYAGFLGLPVEPLVGRFREEAGWARPVTAPKVAAPRPVSRDREVGLVGVLVVLGFIVWAVWQIVGRTPPDDEAALPSGFPIADRTEAPQVVSEVTTSLEDDLTRMPPSRVDDAPVAAGTEAADPAASRTEPAAADASPPPSLSETGIATMESSGENRAVPPVVPLVLTSPLREAAAPDEEPTAEATPTPTTVGPSPTDVLNEQFLREVIADNDAARAPRPEIDRPTPAAEPASAPTERVSTPTGNESAADVAEPGAVTARPAPSVAGTPQSGLRIAAVLTDPVAPVYPRRCRRTAEEREVVTVRFTVSRFGRVVNPSVAETTNTCFDSAALSAVSRFGFDPATEGGRAVSEANRTSRIVFQNP